ncbi:MAG: hypothetical protein C0434_05900 [Xanthomonadaceae bacterium]|nr:hypothetical protein [Xanthomonadaceae bacterium]
MNSQKQAQLLDEAAHWAARLASPMCTAEERHAAECWRNLSPAHAHAWKLALRVDHGVASLADDNAELLAMADAALLDSAASTPGQRRWTTWALAAGVAAAGVFLTSMLVSRSAEDGVTVYESANAADGRRSLALADGSTVELDVGSAIEVELGDDQRRVALLRGRAMFSVAHDAARPFSVQAGEGRTVALGTRFQVDLRGDAVAVTLAEGSVAVSGTGRLEGRSERLQPGEQLSYGAEPQAWAKREVDIQVATGWERGRLVFHGTPLSEALAEVNRYVEQPIRIADPALAGLPVSGNFIAGDSHLVASALVQTLPISAREQGQEIILSRRSD